MQKLIMLKYGELNTKKNNRKMFIDKLIKSIKLNLKQYNCEFVITYSRIYINFNSSEEQIIQELKKIPGIYSIVKAYKIKTDIEDIKKSVKELIKEINFSTFRVTTKRAYKKFEIPSMELSKDIGSIILKEKDCTVDLHNPELELTIEIRDDLNTYLYYESIEGLKGYPLGINQSGLLMLSGGIDSPVAGFLAIKKGIKIDAIYFESLPHTSIEARNKVIKLATKLSEYNSSFNLFIVPFTKIQEAIYKNINENYNITIMRRMMYRISEIIAKKNKHQIIINGESLGQVASQTLTSINVINNVTNMPIIRPLSCMDKEEIIKISKQQELYETSILPFEDCCTIFVPKHPTIYPSLEKCEMYEGFFDYQELINDAISNTLTFKISENIKKYNNLL